MITKFFGTISSVGVMMALGVHSALAGPVVIDGTDANDHGSGTSTTNSEGWLYMQRVLENLSPQVGNGNKTLVDLGTTQGTQARDAIDNAFNLSTLPGSGWSINHINGATDIASFLDGSTIGGVSLGNTGILYIPTVRNTSGDLSNTELSQINTRGAAIANFVGGAGTPATGGGLFSMAESPSTSSGTSAYGWLKSVIPGIAVTDYSGGGVNHDISLTSAGNKAFPGLTNTDLSAGPWHNSFTGNLGSLSVLATSPDDKGVNQALILGGGAGTVISATPPTPVPELTPVPPPTPVPEPSPMLGMLTFGAFGAGSLLKHRKKQSIRVN